MDAKLNNAAEEAVEIVGGDAATPLLLIGDHAGNKVPAEMIDKAGPLGLSAAVLNQHVGWDIGAAAVARGLALRLNATAVLSVYSRLLIDANRAPGDPDSIPRTSDGIPIPANTNLTPLEKQAREDRFFWPYHREIDRQLARLKYAGHVPMIISMHSFTPALMTTGDPRPWHVGIMASRDTRVLDALVAALRARGDLTVGVNEPYSGIIHGYCLKMHGLAQSLPHAQIEVRQDLIESAAGQEKWADLLAAVLRPILADEEIRTIAHF